MRDRVRSPSDKHCAHCVWVYVGRFGVFLRGCSTEIKNTLTSCSLSLHFLLIQTNIYLQCLAHVWFRVGRGGITECQWRSFKRDVKQEARARVTRSNLCFWRLSCCVRQSALIPADHPFKGSETPRGLFWCACVRACLCARDCDSRRGYCPGSGVHRGGVIEMKHNVSLCPAAHLDLLTLRDLALWNATVALFSSLPVERAEHSELARFSSEGEGSLEMDYLMSIGLPHGSPV